jgi:hypothetical protein
LAAPSPPPLWEPLFGQLFEERATIWRAGFASAQSLLLSVKGAKRLLFLLLPSATFKVLFSAVLLLPVTAAAFPIQLVSTAESRPPA